MNGVVVDEAPKFLASIPSEILHVIQFGSHFDAIHPKIISLSIYGITSYIYVRKSTWEENDYTNISKKDLTGELHETHAALS